MVTETETETEVMKGRVMNFPENQLGWDSDLIVGEKVGQYVGKKVDGFMLGCELKLGCSLGLKLG